MTTHAGVCISPSCGSARRPAGPRIPSPPPMLGLLINISTSAPVSSLGGAGRAGAPEDHLGLFHHAHVGARGQAGPGSNDAVDVEDPVAGAAYEVVVPLPPGLIKRRPGAGVGILRQAGPDQAGDHVVHARTGQRPAVGGEPVAHLVGGPVAAEVLERGEHIDPRPGGAQPALTQPAAQLCCALNIHRCFSSPAWTPISTAWGTR